MEITTDRPKRNGPSLGGVTGAAWAAGCNAAFGSAVVSPLIGDCSRLYQWPVLFWRGWSPVRRFNAGCFEVDHPGDYANLNSYQPRDGTKPTVASRCPMMPSPQSRACLKRLALSSSRKMEEGQESAFGRRNTLLDRNRATAKRYPIQTAVGRWAAIRPIVIGGMLRECFTSGIVGRQKPKPYSVLTAE